MALLTFLILSLEAADVWRDFTNFGLFLGQFLGHFVFFTLALSKDIMSALGLFRENLVGDKSGSNEVCG